MTLGEPSPVDHVADQARAVLDALERVLPAGTLLAVALYGSAVTGGLRPDSDLDLVGVLARRLTDGEKRALVEGLVPLSWRAARPEGWRPVELTLVVRAEVSPWRYPPRFDFQYGEWLRPQLTDGDLSPWPPVNPDVAMLVSMVRAESVPLAGPAPSEILDPVPRADVVRAMLDEIPSLLDELATDTRNILLTLSRMWVTVETGEFRSKDAAAAWAMDRLPVADRPLLERARAGYLGEVDDSWVDDPALRSLARAMVEQIRGSATGTGPAPLPPADASV